MLNKEYQNEIEDFCLDFRLFLIFCCIQGEELIIEITYPWEEEPEKDWGVILRMSL